MFSFYFYVFIEYILTTSSWTLLPGPTLSRSQTLGLCSLRSHDPDTTCLRYPSSLPWKAGPHLPEGWGLQTWPPGFAEQGSWKTWSMRWGKGGGWRQVKAFWRQVKLLGAALLACFWRKRSLILKCSVGVALQAHAVSVWGWCGEQQDSQDSFSFSTSSPASVPEAGHTCYRGQVGMDMGWAHACLVWEVRHEPWLRNQAEANGQMHHGLGGRVQRRFLVYTSCMCFFLRALAWKWMAGASSPTCSLPAIALHSSYWLWSILRSIPKLERDCTGRRLEVSGYREHKLWPWETSLSRTQEVETQPG